MKTPEERARWALDPLVAVGPLKFGMTSGQVETALNGAVGYVSQEDWDGNKLWQQFDTVGVTAIYGQRARLVAVAISALSGPMVQLHGVELIARAPSKARADIHDLARREGVSVRVNWSGDPEVAAWGLSLSAQQEWVTTPEGYAARKDRMLTDVLLVGPELAENPYMSKPVTQWRDVHDQQTNPGAWPVRADQDRPRWDCTPLHSVGPLQFGMSPQQVASALGNEAPAARRGHFPWSRDHAAGQWSLEEERFDSAGVTAHYRTGRGTPALGAVTVHGRTGPQVIFDGIHLIGRPVSSVEADLSRYVEERERGLVLGCGGDMGLEGLNLYVRAARAADTVVSEARFCAAEWEDHG
ncbi:hypothetical protein ACGF5F_31245 [Streptomyces sp. NPDC047821]|uniref:hypothetical protein n=1 Tax=Streptomyces sp. NPDC047821 TaxID=3365488 RepID=UPI00371FC272